MKRARPTTGRRLSSSRQCPKSARKGSRTSPTEPQRTGQHKRTREELRAELLQEAEGVVDELLDWHEGAGHETPTLTDIEDVILELRKRLSAKMAEVVIQDQAATKLMPGPLCPTCGREMHYKGQKANTVETRVGTVTAERAYYYCPACQRGLFPPGSPTDALGWPLE